LTALFRPPYNLRGSLAPNPTRSKSDFVRVHLDGTNHPQAQTKETACAVFGQVDTIEMMAELLQMYRDKVEIFASVLKILMSFCEDPTKTAEIKAKKATIKRFAQIQTILERKLKLGNKTRERVKKGETPAHTKEECLRTLTRFNKIMEA
jgi:hypothetical protein